VQYFQKLNVEVLGTAANGKEGIEKYVELSNMEIQPDIVTLDISMPICDGKKAGKMIREFENLEGLKGTVIIMMSANCLKSEIDECLNKNGKIRAKEFMRKPIHIEDFRHVIGKYSL